jgi:hypothetical protein
MDRLFLVNAPSVVSEIIDGEVIVMNLKSGNYYSSDKVGAVVWAWMEEGKSESEIMKLAGSRYRASAQKIHDDLQAFLGRLLEEGLVREVAAQHKGASGGNGVYVAGEEIFVTPELCAYTDMQDLLVLDPIHGVDAVGWPTPKEAELD